MCVHTCVVLTVTCHYTSTLIQTSTEIYNNMDGVENNYPNVCPKGTTFPYQYVVHRKVTMSLCALPSESEEGFSCGCIY